MTIGVWRTHQGSAVTLMLQLAMFSGASIISYTAYSKGFLDLGCFWGLPAAPVVVGVGVPRALLLVMMGARELVWSCQGRPWHQVELFW